MLCNVVVVMSLYPQFDLFCLLIISFKLLLSLSLVFLISHSFSLLSCRDLLLTLLDLPFEFFTLVFQLLCILFVLLC